MDETLEMAARRELLEETSISGVRLEQLYTFGDPDRDPRTRVISVVYFAVAGADQALSVRGGDDAAEARWWSIHDLPELAFDHERILHCALQRLRWKLETTALGFHLLPQAFTLDELQAVYQTVLHETLDKRTFRRKILASGVLEETDGYRENGRRRGARLYRFTAAAIEAVAR